MENDISINDVDNFDDLVITHDVRMFLQETAKWAKFLSIVGFVMLGFLVIMALFISVFMGAMMSEMPEAGPFGAMGGGLIGVFYILIALIYFFPILYLYRFATKMKTALNNNDQSYLSASFKNLKSCYKFMGIFMIIVLGFYALGIVFAFLMGAGSMMG